MSDCLQGVAKLAAVPPAKMNIYMYMKRSPFCILQVALAGTRCLCAKFAEDETSEFAETAAANSKRRRLEADQHLFQHSAFQISPEQGSIWPGMEAEITVTFQPDHAKEYKATAYCEVGGRASRLPIQLCGTSLGPKAVFSYDLLDIGEAFINTPHRYEVELLNRFVTCASLHDGKQA